MIKHDHLYMLQRSCYDLDGGSLYDCNNPLQGGTEPNVGLFNYGQVLGYTSAGDRSITALTLDNNATGYLYQGFGKSVAPQMDVVKTASGQNQLKHQVGLVVFDRSQNAKNNIEKLMAGRFVAMVQSKSKDASAFSVYGLTQGLELVAGTIQQLNENQGAYSVTLATTEGCFENRLDPNFYDGTSFATTVTLANSYYYNPAVLNLSVLAVTAAGGTALIVTGKNFYGGGAASAVTSVQWQNQSTMALVSQTGLTVSSNTTMNFSSVALTAGTYKLKVTTTKGVAYSVVNVVSS